MHGTDLSLIVFGPLILGLGLFFPKPDDRPTLTWGAVVASAVPFIYSLQLLWTYDPSGAAFQSLTPQSFRNWISIVQSPWINGSWGAASGRLLIEYLMGIDGISLFLVLLTTLLTPLAILASQHGVQKNYREFLFTILALETAVLGCFTSLDLVLFSFFWIATLIPMFALIGYWGTGRHQTSAIKFATISLIGSSLMVVAILALSLISSDHSFNLMMLFEDPTVLRLSASAQNWLFWGFFLAFAVRIPIFPFHTWLPDASNDIPLAARALMIALLLKTGTYGILRFCIPLFPSAAHTAAPLIGAFAVVSIIYGAWVALPQRDLGRLIAYSSLSQMGIAVLGIFAFTATGMTGAMIQMLSHGLIIVAIIICADMIQSRFGTDRMDWLPGIFRSTPVLAGLLAFFLLALAGLPGLSGFTAQFLVFLSVIETAMKGSVWWAILGAFALTAIIWTALYMLSALRRILFGGSRSESSAGPGDLDATEKLILVPLIVLIVYVGLFSGHLTSKMEPSIYRTLELAGRTGQPTAEAVEPAISSGQQPGSFFIEETPHPTPAPPAVASPSAPPPNPAPNTQGGGR